MTKVKNNQKGILFILMGMAFFSIQDALIKFIYEDAALYELYFGRTVVALFLLVGYLKFSNQKIILKTHYPLLTIFRVICFFFGFSFFYISLTYIYISYNILKRKSWHQEMVCNFCWFSRGVYCFKSKF